MFFVGISEKGRPGYRQWLTENCAKAGYRPKILQESDLDRPLLHAVANGLGVALLPEPARRLPHPKVVFRPVRPPIVTPFWITWYKATASDVVRAFVEIIISETGGSGARA